MNTKHLIAANEAHADAHEAMREADFDARLDEMNREFEALGFFDDPTPCETPCGAWHCQACQLDDDELPF